MARTSKVKKNKSRKNTFFYFEVWNGKKYLGISEKYRSKAEAERARKVQEAELIKEPEKILNMLDDFLPEVVTDYIELMIKPRNLRPSALENYFFQQKNVKKFLNFRVSDLTFSTYQAGITEIGKHINRDQLGRVNSTIRHALAMKRRDGYSIPDFTEDVLLSSKKSGKKPKAKYINQTEDFLKLRDYLKTNLSYKKSVIFYYLYLACWLDIRSGELLALTWTDVDFKKKIVFINNSMNSETLEVVKTKTPDSKRVLPLASEPLKALRKLKREQAAVCKNFGFVNEEEFIFFQQEYKGGLPKASTIRKFFYRVQEKPGIPDHITVYGLRHTVTSYLKKLGLGDDEIIQMTGHKDVNMFNKTYRHTFEDDKLKNLDKIRKVLESGKKQEKKSKKTKKPQK